MSKWWVVLGFDEEVDANAFADCARDLGSVEARIGAGWHRIRATVEQGPYVVEDES